MKEHDFIETKEITKALVKKNKFSILYPNLLFMLERVQIPRTINPEDGTVFGLEAYYGIHISVPLIEQFEDFSKVEKLISLFENIAPSVVLTAASCPPDGEHLKKDYIWFWGVLVIEKAQLVTAINIMKKILYALLTIIRLEWIVKDKEDKIAKSL